MSNLTRNEKIAIAEKEIATANLMIEHSRKQLAEWLNVLEVREDYLETLKPIVKKDDPKASKPKEEKTL